MEDEQKQSNQSKITELLTKTKRPGIGNLIKYMEESGFFTSPASTKFHGCYSGGLAKHSMRVYELAVKFGGLKLDAVTAPGQKPLEIKHDTVTIATLLHDIFKAGAYIGTEKPYTWNKKTGKGHALLSIEIIQKYIELTELEILIIKFHMGVYGLFEFYEEDSWGRKTQAEYPLRGDHSEDENKTREQSKIDRYGQSLANAWYHNPICKIVYYCDEIATLEEKTEE